MIYRWSGYIQILYNAVAHNITNAQTPLQYTVHAKTTISAPNMGFGDCIPYFRIILKPIPMIILFSADSLLKPNILLL